MDNRTIAILEFPSIVSRLATATSFPPGRRLAEALTPSADPVVVARALAETDQARALLTERPGVGIGRAHDIGPSITRAVRGGRLEPTALLDIAETLDAAARLATALSGERRPLLRSLSGDLHGLPSLSSTIARSVDPSGEILDGASPRLGGLRAAVRIAYERLRRRLDSLVGSELGGALQEPLVTLRNGRYVVPVKAEARGRVKGIVHDASGSGQTLFVEPLVVVELGNAWREAQVAEQAEVERILDELSGQVAGQATALQETLAALARFDFWTAKAALAADLDAVRAETADRAEVVLLGARHPGLGSSAVPIDLRLGDGYSALVVTGPNTGGKTVALRTLGLLALMHQAGLHVPAAVGSRLPVFRDVCADIGDEQSIAQSLSTFSGHLGRITAILGAAGPGVLVILDELGAGTDPTEGSALAQALLDHFIRAGALVAATTHYAELKAYAHTTPGARNAAVQFDLETLRPTYHLTIGLPGGSQAFAIAERLGVPGEIIADARARLTEGQRTFEATLAAIQAAEGETVDALVRARTAEAQAAEALRAARDERSRARRERDETVAAARADAERAAAAVRDEVAATRRLLERQTLTAQALDAALARVDDQVDRLGSGTSAPAPGGSRPETAPPPSVPAWRRGDRVRSRTGGWEGRITALDRSGRRATVETGGLRVAIEVDDLEPAVEGARPPGGGPSRRPSADGGTSIDRLGRERARGIAASLDVRGARVDEALEAIDRYLDDAVLAGLDRVTVVHGLGTGALRDAIRAAAAVHPLVRDVRAGERGEGGDGATVIRF